jgi:hypothetical protein
MSTGWDIIAIQRPTTGYIPAKLSLVFLVQLYSDQVLVTVLEGILFEYTYL